MSQSYILVSYHNPRPGRAVRVGFTVDGIALLNVANLLYLQGWEPGPILLNHPPSSEDRYDAEPIDFELQPDDFDPQGLVVTGTRLDINPLFRNRKRVQRGGTEIERHVERAWRRVLKRSQRLQVILQPFPEQYFADGYATRRNIEFYERESAHYSALPEDPSYRRRRKSHPATAAYLLRLSELWPGGPGYLGFFGMNSTTALAWSQLLTTRHADLLHREGFYVAELEGVLPKRVGTLRWADDWKSRIVLSVPEEEIFRAETPQTM